MLIQTLKHTPISVYILFFVLLIYGYAQRQTRLASCPRLCILPAIMVALTLSGVHSAFGLSLNMFAAWAIGIGVAVWEGLTFGSRRGVSYSEELEVFHVPGSWVPLILMMTTFFIKFAVGVAQAHQLVFTQALLFGYTISFVYGVLCGMFVARAVIVWRCTR